MLLTTDAFELLHLPVDELVELRTRQTLADSDGDLKEAAQDLGISLRTLQRWVKEANHGAVGDRRNALII